MIRAKEIDTVRRYESSEFIGDSIIAKCQRQRPTFARALVDQWADRVKTGKSRVANRWFFEQVAALESANIRLAAEDEEVRDKAKVCARRCGGMSYEQAAGYCDYEGVAPPELPELPQNWEVAAAVRRMQCEQWWRRKLRTLHGRAVEKAARSLNLVNDRRAKYASDEALRMHREQYGRNAALLEMLEATNEDTGQVLKLAEVAALNPSNPTIRRAELMVRMRGFEDYAKGREHAAMFYTITTPSRYHASHSKTGKRNRKHTGETPRDGQKYLSGLWARARAKFHRLGITVYGFRVAEPHHDGTPHWHLLLFMAPENKPVVSGILRDYATREDGAELNTANRLKARFKPVEIDPKRGSATGYIAKYIAKNVGALEGTGMQTDLLGGDIDDYCERVRAWASRWGIRQFQQIGGPPVTVWRELRRVDKLPQGIECRELEQIHAAADLGEWSKFVERMGGAECPRAERPVQTQHMNQTEPNRYGEPARRLVGIRWRNLPVISRPYRWTVDFVKDTESSPILKAGKEAAAITIDPLAPLKRREQQRSGEAASTWSAVNNCTAEQEQEPAPPVTDNRAPDRPGQQVFKPERGKSQP